MPQPKSSGSGGRRRNGGSRTDPKRAGSAGAGTRKPSTAPKPAGRRNAQKHDVSQELKRAAQPGSDDAVRASLQTFAELVHRGMEGPVNLVMLSAERIQDAMDDAVERGRMTRSDAEDLVQELIERGRRQTEDIVLELEQLVGRARRATGLGPTFPIPAYEELTAAQVADQLNGLTAAELRKVRDYERRHGNRKSVIDAIERQL